MEPETKKVEKRKKLKDIKTDMFRSISKQAGEKKDTVWAALSLICQHWIAVL